MIQNHSLRATAAENKKVSEPIASDIPEKSNPEEITNLVTVTMTNMSDAISPNEKETLTTQTELRDGLIPEMST